MAVEETDETNVPSVLYKQAQALEGHVDAAMVDALASLGLPTAEFRFPALADAHCGLQRDPFSGEASLLCHWLDRQGQRTAELVVHPDGAFWAERDVLCPCPGRSAWVVEAVAAWSRDGHVEADPRLIPNPAGQ